MTLRLRMAVVIARRQLSRETYRINRCMYLYCNLQYVDIRPAQCLATIDHVLLVKVLISRPVQVYAPGRRQRTMI